MTLASRLVALERDRHGDALTLTDWFERTIARRVPDLDADAVRAVTDELFEADPTLVARLLSAYRALGALPPDRER